MRVWIIHQSSDAAFVRNTVYLLTNSPEIRSSTPSECKRSSTVFDIIGGPRRKWLARRNSHASLACRTSSSSQKVTNFLGALFGLATCALSPQKLKIFGAPAYYGYLCGSSPMKKTILDLLHPNESK